MKPILVIRSPIPEPTDKKVLAGIGREYHIIWIEHTFEDFSFELLTVNKAENLTDEKINEIMELINNL